jgi:hypothetical protein
MVPIHVYLNFPLLFVLLAIIFIVGSSLLLAAHNSSVGSALVLWPNLKHSESVSTFRATSCLKRKWHSFLFAFGLTAKLSPKA